MPRKTTDTEMRVMKQRLATALVLTCAALFAQSVGAAQPVSIGNYGEDGDGIFYGVICDDNSEGSVIKRIEPPKQICAQPAFGDNVRRTYICAGST